jgi:mono/diheme cytochrome c family protein
MKPAIVASIGVLVLTTAAANGMGGWAIVSIVDPPTHLVAGAPNVIEFAVRQHGDQPLGNLNPNVSARSGVRWVRAHAEQVGQGTYRATLNVPTVSGSGEWRIKVDADFGDSRGELVPLRAIAKGETAPRLTDSERGRHLFAAKGCVSCHVHSSVDIVGQLKSAGPDLSGRRFPAEYLSRFLADPSIKTSTANNGVKMPNPRLRPQEISALIAFINADRQVSAK